MVTTEIQDEAENLKYLKEFEFDKTLPKLIKKLQGKTIVIYGAGVFFQTIKKYFSLSQLNIIGISDMRFREHTDGEEYLGYKVYSPLELKALKPDYVLVATKRNLKLMEDLYHNILKGTNIKIIPLVNKDFLTIIRNFLLIGVRSDYDLL